LIIYPRLKHIERFAGGEDVVPALFDLETEEGYTVTNPLQKDEEGQPDD